MKSIQQSLIEHQVIIKEVRLMRRIQKSYNLALFEKDQLRIDENLKLKRNQENRVDLLLNNL